MSLTEFIDFLKSPDNNALIVRSCKVLYAPDKRHSILVVARVEHRDTGIEYDQVLRRSTMQAQYLGQALLVQGKVADNTQPPDF